MEEAPYAFSGTLEAAKQRSEESWAAWAENGSNSPKAVTFIAYHDDRPCGMMGCRLAGEKNEVAELLAVWVAPEYRRLKVGQALLGVVKQWPSESQAQVLHIWVAEQNASAISFYMAAGCKSTDQRQAFNSDASQEEILLLLQLNNKALYEFRKQREQHEQDVEVEKLMKTALLVIDLQRWYLERLTCSPKESSF